MVSSELEDDSDTYEDDYEYYEGKSTGKPPRQYGNILVTIVIIVIIILLLLVAVHPGFREALGNGLGLGPTTGQYREYPEWADFTVERTILVSPDPVGAAMSYTVDIPKPKDIPNETDPWLHNVKSIISNPDREEIKYPGNQNNYTWMFWEGSGVTSPRTLTIRYSIYTESVIWTLDPSESGGVEDIPKWLSDWYGNKTQDEWKILPTNPDIKALSNQLTSGKSTVYDQLSAIFNHLNEKYEYETIRGGEPKYCYETLNDKSGDCDDQSVLFISLARAAGLPAWLEFGALYNYQEKTWGGHAWVKVYIPYYSGGGFWYNIDIVNDHFLFRDAYRFTEWESDGNGDHLRDYYYSNGSYFSYDESYETISMKASSKTIRIGEDGRPIEGSIPGFEAIFAVPAIAIIALTMRRKKRIQ